MNDKTLLLNRPVSATHSTAAYELQNDVHYALQANVVASPTAKTFTDANVTVATDNIAIAAHGFYTGLKVQGTTTGTLPAGLALTTDYWVIVVDSGNIKLASSLANADAGTAVDITAAAGTGTHTLTATAGTLAHSMQLQKSNDGSNWIAEGSATAVSAAGSTMFEGSSKGYKFLRVTNTVTTGQAVYTYVACSRGG